MQPFPKRSHDVRSLALEQVCNSVCGPRTKKIPALSNGIILVR